MYLYVYIFTIKPYFASSVCVEIGLLKCNRYVFAQILCRFQIFSTKRLQAQSAYLHEKKKKEANSELHDWDLLSAL